MADRLTMNNLLVSARAAILEYRNDQRILETKLGSDARPDNADQVVDDYLVLEEIKKYLETADELILQAQNCLLKIKTV